MVQGQDISWWPVCLRTLFLSVDFRAIVGAPWAGVARVAAPPASRGLPGTPSRLPALAGVVSAPFSLLCGAPSGVSWEVCGQFASPLSLTSLGLVLTPAMSSCRAGFSCTVA